MKKISETIIVEFKYDSEEEREIHIKEMEQQGFICDGQVRKSNDLLTKENRNWYWYGKFYKQI